MLASQLGTRRPTRIVRSGCTVITRVNTKKLGPMMLDTVLIPAAMTTIAASTNSPDEAVASADAAEAGFGGVAAAGPLSSRAAGMMLLSSRQAGRSGVLAGELQYGLPPQLAPALWPQTQRREAGGSFRPVPQPERPASAASP